MKYTLLILSLLVFGCKKEDPTNSVATKTIKYSFWGDCCNSNITYTLPDGNTTTVFVPQGSWDYTTQIKVGTSVTLKNVAQSSDQINLRIAQDGADVAGTNGWGQAQLIWTVK